MSKIRIYQIAKDLNVTSKEIIEKLQELDVDVKNHMSTLTDPDINLILERYTQEQAQPEDDKEVQKHKKVRHEKKLQDGDIKNKEEAKNKPDDKNLKVTISKRDKKVKDTGKETKSKQKTVLPKQELAKPDITKKPVKTIKIGEQITVGNLANKLQKPLGEIMKKLMTLNIMATINENIDYEVAELISEDFGIEVEKEITITEEDILLKEIKDDPKSLKPRSPIVVVMGHVDHGKTSLLDAIRAEQVAATEAGGITQHIGAYRVKINDKEITFLDTPGHEAFTAMRARGAQVTDIAVLVVAADDGIMPQTIEAINHAKAANVTIIVAINKIDRPEANPEKIKQELTEYGLVPEEWGGDTICVPVSALKREGIDDLLEMILLVAEMQELKANPKRLAWGTVIESKLDKGRGPVATILVQKGTLKVGDIIVAGVAVGRVRAMMDDKGKRVVSAGPSTPVEILGLSEVPDGGDPFYVVKDEKKARSVVNQRKYKIKDDLFKAQDKVTLEDLFDRIKEGDVKDLNIIVKADVQGSVEAIRQSLEKLTTTEVRMNIIHGGVGGITESDVMLAAASNAIIIGFNVRPDTGAISSAELQDVEIRLYRVIYDAIEDIEAAMKGMLDPEYKEKIIGHVEVRATFKVSGIGTIAGCYVTDGKITRNADIRIVRDGIVIHEGKLESLKRFKDDVREVLAGYECGIGLERFNDIKEGDILECSIMEEIKR